VSWLVQCTEATKPRVGVQDQVSRRNRWGETMTIAYVSWAVSGALLLSLVVMDQRERNRRRRLRKRRK
jgi:hypothetical protein